MKQYNLIGPEFGYLEFNLLQIRQLLVRRSFLDERHWMPTNALARWQHEPAVGGEEKLRACIETPSIDGTILRDK